MQRDFNDYAKIRAWTIERARDRNELREARPSFIDGQTDPSVVGHRLAAMPRSWLYFRLLEAISGKMVDTSYSVRPESSGRLLLYSQNGVFLSQTWVEESRRQSQVDIKTTLENTRDNLMSEFGKIHGLEPLVGASGRLYCSISRMG